MVLLNAKPSSLENRQALLEITLTTSSPTLYLSTADDPTNPFHLILTGRIAATAQPGRPITICTHDTVLDTGPADLDVKPSFDIMALGAFTPLQCTSDPQKTISLGNWKPNVRHPDPPLDMRERDWLRWLTVPAEGSVQVTHALPLDRMFKYECKLKREDVKPGETYRLHMNAGHVGTMWWCWGDLNGDLKGKKFSEWRRGWDGYNFGVEKPDMEVVEREGWVLGEDPEELWVEDSAPIFGVVAVSFIVSFGVCRVGYYTPFMIRASILLSIGIRLITTWKPRTALGRWIGYQVLLGAGGRLAILQAHSAAQTVLSLADVPTGDVVIIFAQIFSGTLVISVLMPELKTVVPEVDSRLVQATGATSLKGVIGPQSLSEVLRAYNGALTRTFYVAVALAVASIVGALGTEWRSVKKGNADH